MLFYTIKRSNAPFQLISVKLV